MRGRRALPIASLLAVLGLAACEDDVVPACKEVCTLCCTQEEDCLERDYDACRSDCVRNCQRSSAVYRNSTCWDAKLALENCVCSLSCSDLSEWEAGTSDVCADEALAEEQGCDWF